MLTDLDVLAREIFQIRTQLEFCEDIHEDDFPVWYQKASKALAHKRFQWFKHHEKNNLPYVYI